MIRHTNSLYLSIIRHAYTWCPLQWRGGRLINAGVVPYSTLGVQYCGGEGACFIKASRYPTSLYATTSPTALDTDCATVQPVSSAVGQRQVFHKGWWGTVSYAGFIMLSRRGPVFHKGLCPMQWGREVVYCWTPEVMGVHNTACAYYLAHEIMSVEYHGIHLVFRIVGKRGGVPCKLVGDCVQCCGGIWVFH